MIDADCDRIEGIKQETANIVMYEGHDLETTMLYSEAIQQVLREYGSEDKISRFEEDVLEALSSRASAIGCLRLHSIRQGLRLKFDGLVYSRWVDRASFQVCVNRLVNAVKNNSRMAELSTEALLESIREIADADYPPQELCNGDDLIEIFAIGLRSKLGNRRAQEVKPEILRRSFRLAYSETMFKSSRLAADIVSWEATNGNFRILRGNI